MDSVHVVDKLRCEYFDEDLEDVITSELKPKRLKYGAVVPVRIDGGDRLARRRSYFLFLKKFFFLSPHITQTVIQPQSIIIKRN